jgi:hypothetical protein
MKKDNLTTIKIYRHCGVWCYSMEIDGEWNHSDTVGCDDDATEAEARDIIASETWAAGAHIVRIAD